MQRFLHVLLIPLSLLAAAVIVMFLMGAALPREHEATVTVVVRAPQGRVWSLLEDVDAQPSWRRGLKAVQPLPNDLDGHRCWVEVQRRMTLPLCEEITDPPITRITAVAEPGLRYGGSWTYNLTALTPDTTSLSILEHGITNPPLFRFFGHYVFHDDAAVQDYAADLQRAAARK